MSTHTYTNNGKEQTSVRGVSLRRGLWEWLYEQAEREEHGNVSRVVGDAVKEYRDRTEYDRSKVARELERVS